MVTDTPELRCLFYQSKVVDPMTTLELSRLLVGAQRFNRGVGVTGVLIYRDGRFLQTIEGPPVGIEAVYKRIIEDRRHTRIESLSDTSIIRRLFPDWVMALSSELGTSLLLRILRALLERPLSGTSDAQRRMVEHMIAELVRSNAGE
jgi:Sensors of blue-light using FAD